MSRYATASRWLLALLSAPLFAQTLADLDQAATKAHNNWFKLASDLDVRVARMLPCDAQATAAIEETGRAATARIVAMTAYTRAAADQASQDVTAARDIQRSEAARITGAATDRADMEAERVAIQTQLTNLGESVRKKLTLTAAFDDLRIIEAMVRDRTTMASTNVSASESASKLFEDLAKTLEQREAALRKQVAALEDERLRWNGYYTARLARARIECSVTGIGR
jgi:hypothetical protein